MRLIDADTLEKEGWSLHRDIQVDKNTREYQTKPLRQVPTIEPEQRWIPCSERLPEDGRQVLVYAISVHFALAKYDEMRNADGIYSMQWVTFDAWKPFYTIKDVVAWMPLPEVYREGAQE